MIRIGPWIYLLGAAILALFSFGAWLFAQARPTVTEIATAVWDLAPGGQEEGPDNPSAKPIRFEYVVASWIATINLPLEEKERPEVRITKRVFAPIRTDGTFRCELVVENLTDDPISSLELNESFPDGGSVNYLADAAPTPPPTDSTTPQPESRTTVEPQWRLEDIDPKSTTTIRLNALGNLAEIQTCDFVLTLPEKSYSFSFTSGV